MAELRAETGLDLEHDRLLAVNLGLMRSLGHAFVIYTKVGHSIFSDDGLGHTYAGAGLKVLIKP